jgi:four helix bundle protein
MGPKGIEQSVKSLNKVYLVQSDRSRTGSPIGASRGREHGARESEMVGKRPKFRFMDLEIWQDAIAIGGTLFDLADKLESKKLYRFAEQLRGSGLSMSNNIAEGSGSSSRREFSSFLNIARRSAFENANVLVVMEKRKLLDESDVTILLQQLDRLCRKITNFQKSLRD